MKLKFIKNEDGVISVKIGKEDFSTGDYIEMIKEIKNEKKIEVEFEENISEDEQDSVKLMIKDINNIGKADFNEKEEVVEDKIKLEDIPF